MEDKNYIGNKPISVEMLRKDNLIIKIELEGYQSYEANFSRKLCGWIFDNITFEGVIGLAIDGISGGIYSLTPEQVQVGFRASLVIYSQRSNDYFVAIVLQPDPTWKKVGNLIVAD